MDHNKKGVLENLCTNVKLENVIFDKNFRDLYSFTR